MTLSCCKSHNYKLLEWAYKFKFHEHKAWKDLCEQGQVFLEQVQNNTSDILQ